MKLRSLLLVACIHTQCALADDSYSVDSPQTTEYGKLSIVWQHPDKYRDIKAVSGKQSRYQQRVFDTLTKSFAKASAKILSEQQRIQLVVTDIDLAGDVRPTFGATPNDVRVVKDIYPPRMRFSYRILEGDQLIMAGTEKLSNLGFLSSTHSIRKSAFRHEVALFTKWLNKTVKPLL